MKHAIIKNKKVIFKFKSFLDSATIVFCIGAVSLLTYAGLGNMEIESKLSPMSKNINFYATNENARIEEAKEAEINTVSPNGLLLTANDNFYETYASQIEQISNSYQNHEIDEIEVANALVPLLRKSGNEDAADNLQRMVDQTKLDKNLLLGSLANTVCAFLAFGGCLYLSAKEQKELYKQEDEQTL